jgi:hypothetical protein
MRWNYCITAGVYEIFAIKGGCHGFLKNEDGNPKFTMESLPGPSQPAGE